VHVRAAAEAARQRAEPAAVLFRVRW
jgi:hypothetical protein